MSRNGSEMDDDEKSARRTSDPGSSSLEPSHDALGRPRNRRSRPPVKSEPRGATTAAKKGRIAKGSGARKSSPPRATGSRMAAVPPSRSAVVRSTVTEGRSYATRDAEVDARSGSPDDVSIPPADLDEHDERFFAEGEAASLHGELLPAPAPAPRGRREGVTAHADDAAHVDLLDWPKPPAVSPERRKKLANYVKVAVLGSMVLCAAAVGRVVMGSTEAGAAPRSAAAELAPVAAPEPSPPPAAQPPAPVAVAQAEPAVAQPQAETPAPQARPVDPESLPPPPPVEAVEASVPLKSAREEREDARRALERGKVKDAIEAATRSVTVDPSDAEAWLVLGAAQQDLGRGADAHASFVSCTKQAKTGNVGECRAMLQWNGPPR